MTGPAAVEVSSMKQLKQVMKANKVAFGVKVSACVRRPTAVSQHAALSRPSEL